MASGTDAIGGAAARVLEARAAEQAAAKVPAERPPERKKDEVAAAVEERAADVQAGTGGARIGELPEFAEYRLLFELDEKRNQVVVRVVDKRDGTVVRTIPPENVVHVLRRLRNGPGAVLDEEI